MTRPTVAIETLGCKLNLADSEQLARDFSQAGFDVIDGAQAPSPAPVDVFVLNTCTVTHVADRKARQQLRRARRHFPNAYLVATGCYPARAHEEVAALEADLVAGNDAKPKLVALVQDALGGRLGGWPTSGWRLSVGQVSNLSEQDEILLHRFPTGLPQLERSYQAPEGIGDRELPLAPGTPPRGGPVRAFVKIQEGCNDYCSYCIIPKTRGVSRTRQPDEVISDIQARESAGYKEVVLTGTQLGDYGIALPGSRRRGPDQRDQYSEGDPLADLLARILATTKIPRLRLSSLQPQDVTAGLLALWRDARLAPHFHLPLQSGASEVLRRMRRRYRAPEFLDAVARIREAIPDVSVTTDIIVGFPGETEDDFEATLTVCRLAGFAAIHVFPYSDRPGTLATRLEGRVPDSAKREREQRLLALAEASRTAHQARFLNTLRTVLWEERRPFDFAPEPAWHGLTDNYLRVFSLTGDAGLLEQVRLVKACARGIWAEK